MLTRQIGDIKIQYDETITDIDRIAEIIKLNQTLFLDYKEIIISLTACPNVDNYNRLYINDFDKAFDDHLKLILADSTVMQTLENPKLLLGLYVKLFAKKAIQNGAPNVMIDVDVPDDFLWFMIACKYFDFKTNFHEMSNFLKYRKESETIFNWLKETQRFNIYNYLLEFESNYLKQYDPSFFTNIDELLSEMSETTLFNLSSEKVNYDLPKLPMENFEELLFAFLDSIKAPERWKEIYLKLKNENRIIFEESKDEIDHSECFKDADGIRKIRVTTDGTIIYFITFVHEFMHFIYLCDSFIDFASFSLLELPPLYFERIAAKYLISIGYDENIIKQVIETRNQNNIELFWSLADFIKDLCRFNIKGPITREYKIKSIEMVMNIIYETRIKLAKTLENAGLSEEDLVFLTTKPNYNYGEIVDKDCDSLISQFIEKGILVLDGYQYLMDSYLVNHILEKENNDNLDKMIYVTDHLAEFNVEKIINCFGINKEFTPNVRKLKTTLNVEYPN